MVGVLPRPGPADDKVAGGAGVVGGSCLRANSPLPQKQHDASPY
jgi:hypothetical protein